MFDGMMMFDDMGLRVGGADMGGTLQLFMTLPLAHQYLFGKKRQKGVIVRRKKLKLPSGKISQPSRPTVKTQKQILQERVKSGQYMLGIAIEPRQSVHFHVNKETGHIEQHQRTTYAHLIPLDEIRTRILLRHINMGIVRICTDDNKSPFK